MNLSLNRKFILLIILLWGMLIYLPSINIHFVNDEIAFIKRCEINSFPDLISLLDKKDFDGIYYRPVGNIVSGITGYFFGYAYRPYRIFNALLHIINGFILFLFLKKVLPFHKHSEIISFSGALIFISFPLNDYAVIWHTDLFDRLMFSFYMLSLIFFIKHKSPGFFSLLFFLLALLTKEMAFSLPLMIFIADYFITSERNILKLVLNSLPYFLMAGLVILFRITAFNNNLFTAEDAHTFQNGFSILKNYILMGGMLIFPFFLREIEALLSNYNYIFIISGLVLTAAFTFYSFRFRRKDFIFLFLILFILITFLPASRLLMRWYLYLPSAGFAALISYLIFSSGLSLRLSVMTIVTLLVLYTSYLIYRQTRWVSVSRQGSSLISLMQSDYKEEISSAGEIYFVTIPAKIDDIPLFHLAFDHHLKHFIAPDKEYIVISRSVLDNFTDTISYRRTGTTVSFEQTGRNFFLLTENDKNIRMIESKAKRIKKISYNLTEAEDRIYFTFSHGKFFLIKEKE